MRINTLNPSLLPAGQMRRVKEILVDPAAALPNYDPQRQPSARPLAERIVEGEILPRPMAAETLLASYHANSVMRAAHINLSATETPSQQSSTSQVLFYLLHSSNDSLSGVYAGKYVDQHV